MSGRGHKFISFLFILLLLGGAGIGGYFIYKNFINKQDNKYSIKIQWKNNINELNDRNTSIEAEAIIEDQNSSSPTISNASSWIYNLSSISDNCVIASVSTNSIIFMYNATAQTHDHDVTIQLQAKYRDEYSNKLDFKVDLQYTPAAFNYILTTNPSSEYTLTQTNKTLNLVVTITPNPNVSPTPPTPTDFVDWDIPTLPGFIIAPTSTTNTNSVTFTLKNNEPTSVSQQLIKISYKNGTQAGARQINFILKTEDWEYEDPTWIPKAKLNISGSTLNGLKSGVDISTYTTLHIPSNITVIKQEAFANVTPTTTTTTLTSNIVNLDFSSASLLTTINNSAFWSSPFTCSVVFPDSLTSIGTNAFYDSLISGVDFSSCDNLKTLKPSIFNECVNIASISFNDALEKIEDATGAGAGTFDMGATGKSKFNGTLKLPKHLKYIGSAAFSGLSNGRALSLNNHLTLDWNNNDSLEYIGRGCFGSVIFNNNTTISFPNTLTTICGSIFSYSFGITQIDIPASVTTIKGNAFYQNDSSSSPTRLNVVKILKTNGVYEYRGGTETSNLTNDDFTKWLRVTDIDPGYSSGSFQASKNGAHVLVPNSLLSQYSSTWPSYIDIQGY